MNKYISFIRRAKSFGMVLGSLIYLEDKCHLQDKMYQLYSEGYNDSLPRPSASGQMWCPSSVFSQYPQYCTHIIFYLLSPLDSELLKNQNVGICVVFSFQGPLIRVSKANVLSHLWQVVFHLHVFCRLIGSFPDQAIQRLTSYQDSATKACGKSDCSIIMSSTRIWAGLQNGCL